MTEPEQRDGDAGRHGRPPATPSGRRPTPRRGDAIAALADTVAELEDRLAAGAGRPGQPPQAVRRGSSSASGRPSGPGWPRQWLPVLDNLDRALAHAGADPAADRRRASGRSATRRWPSWPGSGFPRRDDVGAPFDPARHEAVGVVAERRGAGRARSSRSCGPATATGRPPAAARRGRGGRRTEGRTDGRGRATSTRSSGVPRDADAGRDPARLPQAGPHATTPTSTRTRLPRTGSRRSSEAYDVLSDPETRAPLRRVRRRLPPGAARTSTRRPGPAPGAAAGGAAPGRRGTRPRFDAGTAGSASSPSATSTSTICSAACSAAAAGAAGGRSPAPTRRPSSS